MPALPRVADCCACSAPVSVARFSGQRFATAQASDYRALVCVLLEGGSDGENTLIRYDSAGYQQYAVGAYRGLRHQHRAERAVADPADRARPRRTAWHPACAAMQSLFDQKRLAVIANVGVVQRPVTRAGLQADTDPRPSQLFSHADQVREVQTADATDLLQTGWGGRIADRLSTFNAGNPFPGADHARRCATVHQWQYVDSACRPDERFLRASCRAATCRSTGLRDAALLQMLDESRTNLYEQRRADAGQAEPAVVHLSSIRSWAISNTPHRLPCSTARTTTSACNCGKSRA